MRPTSLLLGLAVGVTFLYVGVGHASPSASASIGERLDRYLRDATARRDFNGAVLVVREGRVLLRKGYGFADAAARTPSRASTRYRISSLTGDITEVAFLQLIDRGRIGLDDSLCEHLHPCPDSWRPITIRLLVVGRSGLPSARPLPTETLTLAGWLARLRARPLAFSAGTARDRSEAGMLVAAHLLETVSRTSWLAYVRRNILHPAGMLATAADRPDLARRAKPYVRTRDRMFGAPVAIPPLSLPDVLYGLASTVDDVYRFEVARRTGRLVSRRLLAEIALPTSAGVAAWPDQFAHLGHGPRGTSDGWYTAYARDGGERVTILAFSNMGGYPLSDVVHRLGLIAIGWPPPRIRRDAAELERYSGTYHRWDASKRRRVTTEVRVRPDGTLLLISDEPAHPRSPRAVLRRSRWRWELVPTTGDAFYASGPALWWGIRVTLEPGESPADDVLVARFVSLGPEHRYRRGS